MYLSNTEQFGRRAAVRRQWRVLYALMLRNIRTKFFGNGLGYVIAVAWPLSHIIIIVVMYSFLRRLAPYGSSTALFIATGVVPFQTFAYVARFMMIAVIKAKPLLAFPEVRVLDILISSALLEIISCCCVVIAFMIMAYFAGINPIPHDIVQAAYAFGACILLGVGAGVLNSVIMLAIPMWATAFVLLIVALWIISGVFFVPSALPEVLRDWLAYQPVLQVVEWTRTAYYEGYNSLILDRSYVVGFGLVMLFSGLVLERALRGHLLAGR
jgi:capsular polysaccharide transport system permease protein